MQDNVNIPISMDWSKTEVIQVVNFYESVDKAYGKGAEKEKLLSLYNHYKQIVPSKAEEKQQFKQYQSQTGQSPYHAVKKAKEESGARIIRM